MNQGVEGWLDKATANFPYDTAQALRRELYAHYDDALASYTALPPEEAQAQALAMLGSPQEVSRALAETHFTQEDMQMLRQNHDWDLVSGNNWWRISLTGPVMLAILLILDTSLRGNPVFVGITIWSLGVALLAFLVSRRLQPTAVAVVRLGVSFMLRCFVPAFYIENLLRAYTNHHVWDVALLSTLALALNFWFYPPHLTPGIMRKALRNAV